MQAVESAGQTQGLVDPARTARVCREEMWLLLAQLEVEGRLVEQRIDVPVSSRERLSAAAAPHFDRLQQLAKVNEFWLRHHQLEEAAHREAEQLLRLRTSRRLPAIERQRLSHLFGDSADPDMQTVIRRILEEQGWPVPPEWSPRS